MSDETARIRLKIGQLEVEYEGHASFLQDELFNLMQKVVGFYTEHKAAIPADPPPARTNGAGQTSSLGNLDHSTNTIATHLSVNSGPDLVIAAAAQLTFVQGKDKLTRKEIGDEMQGATTFYKESMLKNFTASLGSLVKNKRLNFISKDTYALSAPEKTTLETKLAEFN